MTRHCAHEAADMQADGVFYGPNLEFVCGTPWDGTGNAATVTADGDSYANVVTGVLMEHGLGVETDLRNERNGYKIREHSMAKVPVLLVVGKREA